MRKVLGGYVLKNFIGIALSLLMLSGCTNSTTSTEQSLNSETSSNVSVDSTTAEEGLRQSLYENLGIAFLTQCPDLMSGPEGSKFTCFACPQDYVASQVGGGYFYGDGTNEFRCDAAYEGFAIDYEVIGGEMLLNNGSTRGAVDGKSSLNPATGSNSKSQAVSNMNDAFGTLNSEDVDGEWIKDPYKIPNSLSVGVLLDTYSQSPEGCAIWWFKSATERETATENGEVNLFSDFYQSWDYDDGSSVLVVAQSQGNRCYKNLTNILNLN